MNSVSLTRACSGELIKPTRIVGLHTRMTNLAVFATVLFMINSSSFALWTNSLEVHLFWVYLTAALMIMVPCFGYFAIRGELLIRDEYHIPKVLNTLGMMSSLVAVLTLALLILGLLARPLPFDSVGLGNYARIETVRNFVSMQHENGKPLPEQVRGDYTGDLAQLREAFFFVNDVLGKTSYERAMMSMTLLDLEHDPVFLAGKENGWLSETQLEELGNRLRAKPPQVSTVLQQQAYLRLVGEVSMDRPFPDLEMG